MSREAPIYILYGTSTAGKSTICSAFKEKFPSANTHGYDQEGAALEGQLSLRVTGFSEESRACFERIKKAFSSNPQAEDIILRAIHSGKVPPTMTSHANDFQSLIASHQQYFQKYTTTEAIINRIADRAIAESRAGRPSMVDFAPIGNINPVEIFEARLREKKHPNQAQVLLVHCPIPELVNRIHTRNQNALAIGGNPRDARFGIEVLEHYAQIFKPVKLGTENSYTLTRAEVADAVTKLTLPSQEPDPVKVKALYAQLGFADNETTSVTLAPKHKYASVDTETKENTPNAVVSHLAKDLITQQSVKNLDALDLATFVLSPEVQKMASKMKAVAKTNPPLPSETKDKLRQTFAEKMVSRTQHGSREV